MASVVSICNLALANIGKASAISSLDEASAEAKACKQFYAQARDVLLSKYPWNFAARTTALAAVANDKPNRWLYAYARPSDCLRVRRVTDANMADDVAGGFNDGLVRLRQFAHDVEGGTIFTNLSPAYLIYTVQLADPSRFSALFVDALSWELAVRLAMPLTRDPKIRADAYQLAVRTASDAANADASETLTTSDAPAEAIEAR